MRFRTFLITFFIVAIGLAVFVSAAAVLNIVPNPAEPKPIAERIEKPKRFLESLFNGEARNDRRIGSIEGIGEPPPNTKSYITGLPKATEADEQLIGVMIDEAPGARGNYKGVERAKLFLEMPAEGGVPRMMALFSDQDLPEQIGPVRSARHYFFELAEPWLSAFVHAGGSPQAYSALFNNSTVDDFDEDLSYMTRDRMLAAPHNLFLDTPLILDEISNVRLGSEIFSFDDELVITEELSDVSEITVRFVTERHRVDWQYDAIDECYQRNQTMESIDLCVENIVVLIMPFWLIDGDEKNRLNMQTTGNGTAFVFRDGKVIEGQWMRSTDDTLTLLTTDMSQVIDLKPGRTFFQATGTPESVTFNIAAETTTSSLSSQADENS
jgi:hypothetical protein